MNEAMLWSKMVDLMYSISILSDVDRKKLIESTNLTEGGQRKKLGNSAEELREVSDFLRLAMGYIIFDLEATRRENKNLRAMMDRMQQNEPRGDDGQTT